MYQKAEEKTGKNAEKTNSRRLKERRPSGWPLWSGRDVETTNGEQHPLESIISVALLGAILVFGTAAVDWC